MAVSVLNITHHDGAPGGGSNLHTISIPSTTAGSTLVVLVGVISAGLLYIGDDSGNPFPSNYLQGTNCSVSGGGNETSVNYRPNVPAGLTFVNVYTNANGRQTKVTVIEVAGLNATTPFDVAVKNSGTAASGPWYESSSVTSAYTNTLYVAMTTQTSGTLGNFFNSPFYGTENPDNSSSNHIMGYYIGSGAVKARVNKSTPAVTYAMVVAAFNNSPNTWTLSLEDSASLSESLGEAADYERTETDGFSLSEFFDAVLLTHNPVQNLFDAFTMAVSLTTASIYHRLLPDQLSPMDSISFIKEVFRTQTESINLQDWLSVKKTNSTGWGS